MTIKTGSQVINVPAQARIKVIPENKVSVFVADETGQPIEYIGTGGEQGIEFRTKDSVEMLFKVPDGDHFSYEAFTHYEKSDPVPVELPEGNKTEATLMDKMKKFLGSMIEERYGTDSEEMETLEEAMDFDIDGDGTIGNRLTQYEEAVLVPEEPTPASTPTSETGPATQPVSDGGGTATDNPVTLSTEESALTEPSAPQQG